MRREPEVRILARRKGANGHGPAPGAADRRGVPAPPRLQEDGSARGRDRSSRTARPVSLYGWMVLNRQLDERMVAMQRQGRINFYIGSIGEEATVFGAAEGHGAVRLDLPVLPRARRGAAARHAARDLRLRPLRQRRRRHARAPDALPRGVAVRPLRLHQLAHRHADPARGRRRLGGAHQGRRDGLARLLRRGRDQLASTSTRAELRGRAQGAGRVRLPEQRLGHQRAPRAPDGVRDLRPQGRRLRHPRRAGGRQRPARGPRCTRRARDSARRRAAARRCSSA